MFFLDTIVTIDGLLHIGELLTLVGTVLGIFYNMKNKIELLKQKVETQDNTINKLDQKMNTSYNKLELKIESLSEKLERLPSDVITLMKSLKP